MIGQIIIASIVGGFVLVMFILLAISKKSKNVWFCNKMGWHQTPKTIETPDYFLFKGKCPRCNKEVMMDSNGDWFV